MRPYVFTQPQFFPPPNAEANVWARNKLAQELRQTHSLRLDVALNNLGTSLARMTSMPAPQIAIGWDAEKVAKQCRVQQEPTDQILAPQTVGRSPSFVLPVAGTRTLADWEVTELRNPNGSFHVVWFGEVRYTSVNGGDYFTQYCYEYVPIGIPIGTCSVGTCNDMK